MAEYWKSTPKYWCKFCSQYVKDTKFERAQHEATGRHQGNIQRSLRGLHREQEAEQRKKAQAQAEVARLNGLVPGSSSSSTVTASTEDKSTFVKREEKKATLEDRKRQWSQLAAMGIAVPEAARPDMALTGDWKVVREEVVGEVNEDGEFKPVLSKGVSKRKLDEDEQEQVANAEIITKKKGWGNTYKKFPGKGGQADDDVEGLFGKKRVKVEEPVEGEAAVKEEDEVKAEDGGASSLLDIPTEEEAAVARAIEVKKEESSTPAAPAVVFKKRKKIAK